jgi:hypothetical protein
MHKSATKCNKTVGKWCKNKHGASKIIDTLEMYQGGGKPVKGSLFNEDMSLHEAGVDGVVHEIVGMYYARMDGVFHGC